ncbi:MAG: hypothetical protein FJZ47_23595 [Candidatus Tectomicrobia bacterium]|uniref:Glutamate synthase alpha subunit C-terminal domain-containing protein n=1 Tax=Tectimicrobiota bacterium TaxID=2528274 RepID=A0A937W4B0_UNCTE|nr:hypothetical protein [Candidatus Tectomicrobia bacterium]
MNPFEAFRSYSATPRELPLDRILARRDQVLQRLLQSYQILIEEESKQLIWVVEQGALSRAYTTAVEALHGIHYSVDDLEDMCLELDTNEGVTTPMGAPSGLFIAAMCNHVPADEISLNLRILRHRWPFLGYRLPRGRRLALDGDAGDFVGALLEGGVITVTGNAGNYAGIGMKAGSIDIGYSCGKYTGEGMRGGTLRVGGRITALGRVKQGEIYEGAQQVFPEQPAEKPSARKAATGTVHSK